MESKPREIKIWTVLQICLTLMSPITLGCILFVRAATPSEPSDTYFASGGASMLEFFLFWVLVVGFILGIVISFGLWAGKGWARAWGTVYWIFSLLFGLLWIGVGVGSRSSGYVTTLLDILLIVGIVYVLVSLSNLYLATRPRVQGFFKESEMKIAIERVVDPTYYSRWTIGITDEPDRRRIEHDDPKSWHQWRADTENIARNVEKHFLAKGMKGAPDSGEHPNYVYIF